MKPKKAGQRSVQKSGQKLTWILPVLLTILIGIVISTLPHLIAFLRTRSYVWVADTDELGLYLSTAAKSFHFHTWTFTDPLFSEARPSHYPWAQLFPGLFFAKLFHLGPWGIGLMWRVWAGLFISIGWFLIFKFYLNNFHPRVKQVAWVSCGLSILLLSESCLLEGTLFIKQLALVCDVFLRGQTQVFINRPGLHPEWRIITPGLSWFFLQMYLLFTAQAREKHKDREIVFASLALGALFHVYFYFWTAAILGLVLCMVFDQPGRKSYSKILILGSLIGLPFLIQNYLIKASAPSDWFYRTDMFVHIDHFKEWIVPKIGPLLILILCILYWNKKPEHRFLWLNSLAGLLLVNHQGVTGLQIQNFHWNYYWGLFLGVSVLLILTEELGKNIKSRQVLQWGFLALMLVQISSGLLLRAAESTQSKLTIFLQDKLAHYQTQRSTSSALSGNSVLAGDQEFQMFAAVMDNQRPLETYATILSPSTDNASWNIRIALNEILSGISETEFETIQREVIRDYKWGPWSRTAAAADALLKDRQRSYKEVLSHLDFYLDQYHVRYLALGTKINPPAFVLSQWRLIQNGPSWKVWERPNRY